MTTTPQPARPVRLNSGDGIIASVPTLVGFTPADSLVILTLAGRRVGLTLRVDLPPAGDQTAAVAAHAAAVIDQHQPDEPLTALLVLVGDDDRADLVDAVTEQLAGVGVRVQQALHTPQIAAGMPWKCLCDCGNAGILDDPGSSVLAVTAVATTGRVNYRSRAELAAELDSRIDAATARRRAEQIRMLDGEGPEVAAAVLEFGSQVLDGRLDEIDEDVIVGIGAALGTPARRDALVGWTAEVTEHGVMRAAWLRMVQQLPGRSRAQAATVCALAALLDGDGATANVALEVAERTHPGLPLTRLATQLTAAGIEPGMLRALIRDGSR
ncbi:DUF4192 domain-containing protein [Pseudonocardia sp. WMMC193]|uniref:DUF4192 domain-containing protein n=1 Tax=Pseudonocardia sp. WMMC193 TaxID=2911965 RepID=UPI001F32CDC3|nr:DUF4192 domain-containing protein [Pseudonocardia sp. WMMC193]MCF7547329.1 DUF4192 domain-containing protein [Pseudonocardia sp. WMMC193]